MTISDEIKSRVDIVDLVSETVKLRRSGKNYLGFCPFHSNTRTPAFVVFPDTGTWRCFGECNEGGDIFKYVMKKEGWDFSEALKALAKRAGLKLEHLTPEKKEEDKQAEQLRQLLEEVVIFYHSHLVQTQRGKEAYQYLLEKRGLKSQTIETFSIGYAPEGWEITMNHFLSKGYDHTSLQNAGLVVEKEEGGYYDRFRDRIIFPIRDASGRMAGFGARIFNPEDSPKFINSPQTSLFDKSRLLYGLDQARKSIRTADQAVIVEGYLDVVLLHQEGFQNIVSPMGTALTEAQMRQLKRFTRRIVMALDADAAGVKATLRGLEIAREALDHSDDIIFDARGLIHHESRLQADLRVSTLPQGMDPDDIVRNNPEQWKAVIETAKPIITHVMDTLTVDRNLDDPKTKSQIAGQIMPLIRDVPNSVERDAYRQQLARLLHVDVRALSLISVTSRTASIHKKQSREPSQLTGDELIPASIQDKIKAMEKHCLGLLVCQPEVVYTIDRTLRSLDLESITAGDFRNADYHQSAQLILQSLTQDKQEPLTYIEENTPNELFELMQELNQPVKEGELENSELIEDLIRTLLSLRQINLTQDMEQLRALQEEAQMSDAAEVSNFQKQIIGLVKLRALLDQALARPFITQ